MSGNGPGPIKGKFAAGVTLSYGQVGRDLNEESSNTWDGLPWNLAVMMLDDEPTRRPDGE